MSKSPLDQPRFPADSTGKQPLQLGPLPRWNLVLLKNETDNLPQVVQAIMELTHFCRTEATHKMWQAHQDGRSLLLTTYRERAELLVEQFAERRVIVTIEPA